MVGFVQYLFVVKTIRYNKKIPKKLKNSCLTNNWKGERSYTQ